ncbi:hybrid sensor histidine kinase/response regulator [Celeribacter sp. ULVN23_4]
MRPIVQTIARLIATDRRPSVLANETGSILLANAPAQRLQLDQGHLQDKLDWRSLCKQASRATSVATSLTLGATELEGEVVHLSLGAGDGYLLRLSENDHEAAWLRNRSRAATLMRVAHDLRTPIQSLLVTAENILDTAATNDKASNEQARNQLKKTSELALEHISNVLGVIRGEQSVSGLRPDETFNITEELRSLMMMISPIARARDVNLKLWLDPHEDVWVYGPVRFVRALFQNIIDNSAKYGGHDVEIGLSCRPITTTETDEPSLKLVLTVKDMGGGLPPEQKARLLKALGQADAKQIEASQDGSAAQSERPSAGLNVLAHALRQLGGTLEFSDRYVGDCETATDTDAAVIGTVIEVTLVLERGEQTGLFPETPNRSLSEEYSLQGISIILVEDSPASRDWLCHVLRAAGAHVWPAGTGLEALSLLTKPDIADKLDLILTDMTLPYMSGVEFAQRVREDEGITWNGPIMALTAHVADAVLSACDAAGVAKVLEKPIRPAQLRAALRAALDDTSETPQTPPALSSQDEGSADGQETVEVSPFKKEIVHELLTQLGHEGAVSFMTRAHAEASQVLSKLQKDGVSPDTARMLHAATGVCSLTGLGALEACLRSMEKAVDAGMPLDMCEKQLETDLTRTQKAITELP